MTIRGRKGDTLVEHDEHPRPDTTLEALARLKPVNGPEKTVTAGNASGVNDGAAALVLASAEAVEKHGLIPRARVLGMASAGVAHGSWASARCRRCASCCGAWTWRSTPST